MAAWHKGVRTFMLISCGDKLLKPRDNKRDAPKVLGFPDIPYVFKNSYCILVLLWPFWWTAKWYTSILNAFWASWHERQANRVHLNFLPPTQQLWALKGGMVPRIVGCRYLMQKTRLERIPVWYINVHEGNSNEVQISGSFTYWNLTKLLNGFWATWKSKYAAVCRQLFIVDHCVLKYIYNVDRGLLWISVFWNTFILWTGVYCGSVCFKIHL